MPIGFAPYSEKYGDAELKERSASLPEAQLANYQRYLAILERRTPDFQTRRGYPITRPGKANLAMATNQLAGLLRKTIRPAGLSLGNRACLHWPTFLAA